MGRLTCCEIKPERRQPPQGAKNRPNGQIVAKTGFFAPKRLFFTFFRPFFAFFSRPILYIMRILLNLRNVKFGVIIPLTSRVIHRAVVRFWPKCLKVCSEQLSSKFSDALRKTPCFLAFFCAPSERKTV